MTKKIISLLLVIILSVSVRVSADMQDFKGNEFEKAINLLEGIGIINGYEDGNFYPNNPISRSEFIAVITRVCGWQELSGTYKEHSYFHDFDNSYWGAGSINLAKSMGIIDGVNTNEFGINEQITFNQASKILVNVLGYGQFAENSGGYPLGYVIVANQLKLYTSLSGAERELTRGETAMMIYNALTVNVAESFIADNQVRGVVSEINLLTSRLKFEVISGNVTGTPYLSLNTGSRVLREDEIEISGTVYKTVLKDFEDLFGKNVDCYAKTNNSNEYIIYYIAERKLQPSLTIDAGNISSDTTTSEFIYYREQNRIKHSLPQNFTVIYNGKLLSTADTDKDKLKPDMGNVVLYDMDNDGSFEYGVVTDYDVYVIRTLSEDLTAYDVFGKNIDLSSDTSRNIRIQKNGEYISADELEKDDVLVVAESINGEVISGYVSEKVLEGTITEIADGDRGAEYYFEIDGELQKFTLTKEYEEAIEKNLSKAVKPKLGDVLVIHLANSSKIAYLQTEIEFGEENYGYLLNGIYKGISDGVFKILTPDNRISEFHVDVNKKISFGRLVNGAYKVSSEHIADIINEILGDDEGWSASTKQLVRYKLNPSEQITQLYLADTTGSNKDYPSLDALPASRLYSYNVLGGEYIIDKNTPVFNIVNSAHYDDLLSAGNYLKFFSNNSSYNCALYDIENSHVGAIILYSSVKRHTADFDSSIGYAYFVDKLNSPLLYINNVGSVALEDGARYTRLTGISDGEEVSILVDKNLSPNSEPASAFKAGLVIQFETNTTELARAETADDPEAIKVFKTTYDMTKPNTYGQTWNYTTQKSTNAAICLTYGKISDYDLPMVKINTGSSDYMIALNSGTTVMRYHSGLKTFTIVPQEELQLGQDVFVRQRYNNVREIIIID